MAEKTMDKIVSLYIRDLRSMAGLQIHGIMVISE